MSAVRHAEGPEVVTVGVSQDPLWRQLLSGRRSDVFHSPAWAKVLEETYGFEVRGEVVVEEGAPVAGVSFVEVDDPRGRRIVSLPFSDFCDPLVVDPHHWRLLEESLLEGGVPATVRCLRHRMESEAWQETGSFAWHGIDVGRSPDEMWEGLHPSARRAIRKARQAGVEVVTAESEADLRLFFDLHLRVRKHKYGLLAQPYRFFRSIWENFLADGHGRLLLARADAEVVGAVLYLDWGDTTYYKFNASDPGRLGVRPNDLLVWEGMVRAGKTGMAWFDFGVSDLDQEGLMRYKAKYATEEGMVGSYVAGPSLDDRLGPVLGELTGLLTDPAVPDVTTERAGDQLYRFFC